MLNLRPLLERRWWDYKKGLKEEEAAKIERIARNTSQEKVNEKLDAAMEALKRAVAKGAPREEVIKCERKMRTWFYVWDAKEYFRQERHLEREPVPGQVDMKKRK